MISVLLIGMGKFGRTLGERLISMGDEVMIVDKNEDVINPIASKYTNALIANCMNEDSLASMDIPSFDICVVAIGDDFQSSLEITSLLKDLGAKRIISKATTDIQRKFLTRAGADEVIYPERDTAERAAKKFSSDHVFDYLELTDDYGIYEIPLLKEWPGHSIRELNFRARYQVNILGIKTGEELSLLPSADHIFEKDQHLMVIGKKKDVDKILHRM